LNQPMVSATLEKDFYEILGVSRNATQSEIKSSYLALAKKVHPDTKSALDTSIEKYHMRFVELNRAYSTLSHPERRRAYDEQLAAGKSVVESRQQKVILAQFKQGLADLNHGQIADAIAAFERCAQMDPTNCKYHLHLGIAHSRRGDNKRAESCFRECVKMEPRNAEPHYYLGLVYKKTGAIEKARAELTEALYIDPDFSLAAAELEQLFPEQKKSFLGALAPGRIFSKVFKHD